MTTYPCLILLAGYEIEFLGHAQHQGCQQLCSYDIDHMDAPTQEQKYRLCYQNINRTPQSIKHLYVYNVNCIFHNALNSTNKKRIILFGL